MATTRLTAQGMARLRAELEHLTQVRRREVSERIRQAREDAHGDSGDSIAFEDAKGEWALLEHRIAELERTLSNVELVTETGMPSGRVVLGTYVVTRDGDGEPEAYRLVDPAEAAPRVGFISHTSPVGRALLGHCVGDEVAVETPGGVRHLIVVAVR